MSQESTVQVPKSQWDAVVMYIFVRIRSGDITPERAEQMVGKEIVDSWEFVGLISKSVN